MKCLTLFSVLFLLTLSSFELVNEKKCVASWYDMHGKKTASGVKMHRDSLTAAYNYYPIGTKLLVTNVNNNKTCVVIVNDRMGVKLDYRIDLSYKAFGLLDNHNKGKIKVVIKKIN